MGSRLSFHTHKGHETSQKRYFAFFSSDREQRNGWFTLSSKQAPETFRVIKILRRRVQDEEGWKSPSETEMLKVLSTFKATRQ